MPEVLDWRAAPSQLSIVDRAVEALTRGHLVALPTETVYGVAASAAIPEAVERLAHAKGRADTKPMTLALSGAEEVLKWAPGMGLAGRRLARRAWPGPLTLVTEDGLEGGATEKLPRSVVSRVCPAGTLGMRVPDHDAVLLMLQRLHGPLVLTSANLSGQPDATTAEAVVAYVGQNLELVIDDGPSRLAQPSTVVRVRGSSWQVARVGAMSQEAVQRLTSCLVLFVCTGNTCRSPLAEALCKKQLADTLGCSPEDLPSRGYLVLSAGLAAMLGGSAAPEAIGVAREMGVDLTRHVSRPVTEELLEGADLVVAMTRGHKQMLTSLYPELEPRVRLLSVEGRDIPDPIGSERAVYRECAGEIHRHLERLTREIMAA